MNTSFDSAQPSAIRAIEAQRAIPVVRTAIVDDALLVCERLVLAGLDTIELTATIPQWELLLRRARSEFPSATIGVGTITDPDAARCAVDAGAAFLVSPYPVEAARESVSGSGVPFVTGGFTPSEIAAASSLGLAKVFPAHLGGPAYLKTLLAILPGARLMPTGGIKVGEVGAWLAAGAVAVGVGSDLYDAPDLDVAIVTLRRQISEQGTVTQ